MIEPDPRAAPDCPALAEPERSPEPSRPPVSLSVGGWGRVPRGPVAAGLLARAGPTAAAVYLVLCSHAGADWAARPSVGRLATLAGLSRRAVQRALARLADLGLVSMAAGGGRGHASSYTIHPEAGAETAHEGAPFTAQKAHVGAPFTGEKGRTGKREKAHRGARKGAPGCAPTENEQSLNSSRAAAELPGPERSEPTPCPPTATPPTGKPTPELAAAPGPTLAAALTAAGVAEPVLSELAGRRGLTAHFVADTAAQLRGRGLGVGALVNELRGLAAAREAEADRRQRQALAEADRRAAAEAAARRAADLRAAADAELAALPAPELGRLAELVRAQLPPMLQRAVAGGAGAADPLKSRLVRAGVLKRLRNGEAAGRGELLPGAVAAGGCGGRAESA